MTIRFLEIVPVDSSLIPPVELQRRACEFLADAFPHRSGRWRDLGDIGDFPSVGDIDFNEHPEEALANPHYSDQTRLSITINNHRELLAAATLAELEFLLCCSLRQRVYVY
jgi:hypothetical protein